jgi:hypothetical protein
MSSLVSWFLWWHGLERRLCHLSYLGSSEDIAWSGGYGCECCLGGGGETRRNKLFWSNFIIFEVVTTCLPIIFRTRKCANHYTPLCSVPYFLLLCSPSNCFPSRLLPLIRKASLTTFTFVLLCLEPERSCVPDRRRQWGHQSGTVWSGTILCRLFSWSYSREPCSTSPLSVKAKPTSHGDWQPPKHWETAFPGHVWDSSLCGPSFGCSFRQARSRGLPRSSATDLPTR